MWIAYRLLTGDDGGREHDLALAMSFWAAMRTIVIADAVMGLDNVLAVAGGVLGLAWARNRRPQKAKEVLQ